MLFVYSQQEVLPVTRLILEVARLHQVLLVCLNRVHIQIPRLEATRNQAIRRNNKDTHSKVATLRRNLATRLPPAGTHLRSRDILRLNRVPAGTHLRSRDILLLNRVPVGTHLRSLDTLRLNRVPTQEQLRLTELLREPVTRSRAQRAILNKVHKAIRLSSWALRTRLFHPLHP